MKQKILREAHAFALFMKDIPVGLVVLFLMSVFAMNLLANKSILLPVDWLALDCGIAVSWFAFLTMDVVTKHFGPKAATQLSVFAMAVNLLFCLLLFVGSLIPGVWGASFVEGSEGVINTALDQTFGGTWYVLLGSSVAFVVSAAVNNFANRAIGRLFRRNPDGRAAYICRSYLSTALGQFVDNIVFALIVSHVFFGWSLLQCLTCALTGMLVELLCEIIFSEAGFALTKRWKKQGVGKSYLEFLEGQKENCQ